jgi:hypothetical protein
LLLRQERLLLFWLHAAAHRVLGPGYDDAVAEAWSSESARRSISGWTTS